MIMKYFILQLLIILSITSALFADNVKQKLEAFEKGTITLEELTGSSGNEGRQEIIEYYLLHTNSVSIKAKLPISRCFASFDKYKEAVQLAEEYAYVYSNDWHGWKILGGANLALGNYAAAVEALTNSAKLGDEYSYAPLVFAALKIVV